jgi:hypothetical protein
LRFRTVAAAQFLRYWMGMLLDLGAAFSYPRFLLLASPKYGWGTLFIF